MNSVADLKYRNRVYLPLRWPEQTSNWPKIFPKPTNNNMGWDSDSDESVDIDAQLAAKNAAKKNEFDDEEQVLKQIEKQKAATAAKAAVKVAAPSVSSGVVEVVTTRVYDEDEIAQSDPALEKERMKRLQEKAEMALMGDLFAGCDKPESFEATQGTVVREVIKTIKEDSFEKLKLVTTRDVEVLASRCADKVTASEVKSAGHKFLHELIRSLGHVISVTEVNALSKSLKELGVLKAREAAEKLAGKKKLSTDVAQMKKGAKVDVFDAMNEVYGGDYDEEDEEDY